MKEPSSLRHFAGPALGVALGLSFGYTRRPHPCRRFSAPLRLGAGFRAKHSGLAAGRRPARCHHRHCRMEILRWPCFQPGQSASGRAPCYAVGGSRLSPHGSRRRPWQHPNWRGIVPYCLRHIAGHRIAHRTDLAFTREDRRTSPFAPGVTTTRPNLIFTLPRTPVRRYRSPGRALGRRMGCFF
jgi:hypothetical protein